MLPLALAPMTPNQYMGPSRVARSNGCSRSAQLADSISTMPRAFSCSRTATGRALRSQSENASNAIQAPSGRAWTASTSALRNSTVSASSWPRSDRGQGMLEFGPAAILQIRAPEAVGECRRIVQQSREGWPRPQRPISLVHQQSSSLGQMAQERPARFPVPAARLFGPFTDLVFETPARAGQSADEREQAESGIACPAVGRGRLVCRRRVDRGRWRQQRQNLLRRLEHLAAQWPGRGKDAKQESAFDERLTCARVVALDEQTAELATAGARRKQRGPLVV